MRGRSVILLKNKRFACALLSLLLVGGLALLPGWPGSSARAEEAPTPPYRTFVPMIANGTSFGDSPHLYPPLPAEDWLAELNYYRSMAGLPSLVENGCFSGDDWYHARYIVKTDVLDHLEDPANPWYTPQGNQAAQTGNLTASSDSAASDTYAVQSWMQAPFHALGILDPSLQQVGYSSYREADGGLQMGAVLDVLRGLGGLPTGVHFPVTWPADGMTVPLQAHWGETPSPLTACPGYTAPTGLPILLQLGTGSVTPAVSAHSFSNKGTELEHCVFDETSYTNPDAAWQQLGRAILNARDAVVLVPRQPLVAGQAYRVSITANGQTYTWSFTVTADLLATFQTARQGREPASPLDGLPAFIDLGR
jgi:hypothetical protein